MTISIKPTASGSTIEQDGSTILTVDGSGNITAENNFSATGHVLQVVNSSSTTNFSTRSTTSQDTGYSLSITPSSASSKIAVFLNAKLFLQQATSAQVYVYGEAHLFRGTTQLKSSAFSVNTGTSSLIDLSGSAIIFYLDSPNTTSTVTYKLYINALSQDFLVSVNAVGGDSNMTLMEIAG